MYIERMLLWLVLIVLALLALRNQSLDVGLGGSELDPEKNIGWDTSK